MVSLAYNVDEIAGNTGSHTCGTTGVELCDATSGSTIGMTINNCGPNFDQPCNDSTKKSTPGLAGSMTCGVTKDQLCGTTGSIIGMMGTKTCGTSGKEACGAVATGMPGSFTCGSSKTEYCPTATDASGSGTAPVATACCVIPVARCLAC